MRLSATGEKRHGGYTLLEIMAVLALIGLLAFLVYPQFARGSEEAEIICLGRLLKADLKTAQSEAIAGRRKISVEFAANGYNISGGGLDITRACLAYGFSFLLPVMEEFEAAGVIEEEEAQEDESAGAEGDGEIENPRKLIFGPDGTSPPYSLEWGTDSYAGKLTITEEGVILWDYALKTGDSRPALP